MSNQKFFERRVKNGYVQNFLNLLVKKVKAYELRGKQKPELQKQLGDLKQELYQLNNSKYTGSSATNLLNIKELRKGIARVLTVMNEKTRANVRKAFAGKSKKPLDVRTKGTRAWRRRLLPRHESAKQLKTIKKENNFPLRKYGLRA